MTSKLISDEVIYKIVQLSAKSSTPLSDDDWKEIADGTGQNADALIQLHKDEVERQRNFDDPMPTLIG